MEQEKEVSLLCCNLYFGTSLSIHYQKNNSMKCKFSWGSWSKYIWVGFLRLPVMSCIFWRGVLPLHWCKCLIHDEHAPGVTVHWLTTVSNPRKCCSFLPLWWFFHPPGGYRGDVGDVDSSFESKSANSHINIYNSPSDVINKPLHGMF